MTAQIGLFDDQVILHEIRQPLPHVVRPGRGNVRHPGAAFHETAARAVGIFSQEMAKGEKRNLLNWAGLVT